MNIDEIIARKLESIDAEKQAIRNRDQSYDYLVQKTGSKENAVKAMDLKAAELGLKTSYLQDIAASSPKAFAEIMGLDARGDARSPAPDPVNSTALSALRDSTVAKEGTWGWWEAQRKERGYGWYDTPEVQKAIHADAKRLGEAFGLPE